MKATIFGGVLAFVLSISQPASAGLSATYTEPAQAKGLIQRTLQLPQSANATAVFYSSGISHFDSFIPCAFDMKETWDQSQSHWKFTYHDGRISRADYVDASGKVTESFVVWNNSSGAPVLSAYQNKDGNYDWYMYAEFDSSGKIQTLYRYNKWFELEFYDVFSYRDNVTSIQEYSRDSQPRMETIYESNGDLFVVNNGEKRLVNHVDRKKAVCELVKFGLKPFYPNY
jgi:hypothetical protein